MRDSKSRLYDPLDCDPGGTYSKLSASSLHSGLLLSCVLFHAEPDLRVTEPTTRTESAQPTASGGFFIYPKKREIMTATATPAAKETKAQRIERLKREKNPWEVFDEVRAFAREGRSSVVPEWASAYFKWWGIYTQGDGVGAVGGKGGEGLATDYFMMRIGMQILYAAR